MRKAMTILSFRDGNSRRAWAIIGLALFLFTQLLATSTVLHKLVHSDADSVNHHCAVTLLSHGQVNAVDAFVPLAAFVAALFFLLPPLQSAVLSAVDYRFSACRAPPRR
jgi:hypothetical protein